MFDEILGASGWWLPATVVLGWLSWSLVEYGIHGILAHRFQTPVSPLHWGHHRTPAAVFTSPLAWVPTALVLFAAAAAVAGSLPAAALLLGLLAGFFHYEYVHWRIHFREPRSDRERLLREHHLAHHFRNPRAYHGVTTRLWDRVFGTLPADHAADYARVADRRPLQGPSNLAEIWNPRTAWIAIHRGAN